MALIQLSWLAKAPHIYASRAGGYTATLSRLKNSWIVRITCTLTGSFGIFATIGSFLTCTMVQFGEGIAKLHIYDVMRRNQCNLRISWRGTCRSFGGGHLLRRLKSTRFPNAERNHLLLVHTFNISDARAQHVDSPCFSEVLNGMTQNVRIFLHLNLTQERSCKQNYNPKRVLLMRWYILIIWAKYATRSHPYVVTVTGKWWKRFFLQKLLVPESSSASL